jgi:hypothetical protein
MADPTPNIKGALIRSFLIWYTAEGSQERTARLLNRIPRDLLELFDPRLPDLGMLDASWYPVTAVHRMMDVLVDGLNPDQRRQLAKQIARVAMEGTIKGVYRWLFEMMMTPDRYAQRAQMLFSRSHDTGIMTKTVTAPNAHLSVVRDWPGHHPFLCELLLYSSIPVYEAMGCHHVIPTRHSCVSEGGTECSYTVAWSE